VQKSIYNAVISILIFFSTRSFQFPTQIIGPPRRSAQLTKLEPHFFCKWSRCSPTVTPRRSEWWV